MIAPAASDDLHCSFCGKSQTEVEKLIAGPGVYICDVCVGMCNDILAVDGPPMSPGDLTQHLMKQDDDKLLAMLVGMRRARASVDHTAQSAVDQLRSRGVTWARIGKALGMTRQSAWERFSGEE